MSTTRRPTQQAVSIQTAADIYDISEDYIRAEINKGTLPARKIGTRWSIRLADLERWYDALPTDGAA